MLTNLIVEPVKAMAMLRKALVASFIGCGTRGNEVVMKNTENRYSMGNYAGGHKEHRVTTR